MNAEYKGNALSLLTERSLAELIERWSDGTLPAKEWTHAAHVATCSYLAWNNTLSATYRLMKDGLYRYNDATGTPNTDDRGYHETLTRFWCTLLFFMIHRGHFHSCLESANAMVERFGKESRADQAYYSFDVLTSRDARRRWFPPDVRGEIALEAFRW
jgi:hypothetical protein